MELMGLKIVTSDLMANQVTDWSACRSPSRAKRRHRRGFPQHIKYMMVPRKEVLRVANTLVMHPTMLKEFKRMVEQQAMRTPNSAYSMAYELNIY